MKTIYVTNHSLYSPLEAAIYFSNICPTFNYCVAMGNGRFLVTYGKT